MKLTKLLIPLLLVGVLFSCSKEEQTIEDASVVSDLDLVANLSTYEDSSLGMYKGVFTTADSQDRGTVEIKVINEETAKASITYLSGVVEFFNGTVQQQTGLTTYDGMNIVFNSSNSRNSSFVFTVNDNGSNPTITDAHSNSRASLISIVKENQRGAVTTLTGSFSSALGATGTWNVIFNTGTGETTDTDITTQTIFGVDDYGSTTGNEQMACTTVDNVTTCPIGGMYTTLGVDIDWSGVHTFLDSPDCSSSTGTWTAVVGGITSTGMYVSDVTCTLPGNFLETAIPIVPTAAGTADTCATPNFVVDFVGEGFSDSGLNADTTCAISTGADIFYTWTSTSDALVYRAEQINGNTGEDIIIRDAAGTFITCAEGSFFGGDTLSGWTAGDDLIIQITNTTGETTGFCLAESSVPTTPLNDLCMDAFPIACGEMDSGSTLLATDSTGTSGNDVFYSFVPTVEGQSVTVSLCGSGYDTRIRILDACGGTEITQNDDNSGACGAGGNSQVSFVASLAVAEYIFVVEAFSTESGSYSIAVTCVDPAPVCGGTVTDVAGAGGIMSNDCGAATDFVATSTATGTIGTDADIDNVTVTAIDTGFSTPDVNLTLTSPAGTSLDLTVAANTGDGDIDATYRDGGNTVPSLTGELAPQGGTFAATFAGESVTGDWTITACNDGFGANELTWSIGFCDGDIPGFAPTTGNDEATRNNINEARRLRALERERLYEERKTKLIEEQE